MDVNAKLYAWHADERAAALALCEEDIFAFLNALQPDGPWFLVSIQADTGRAIAHTFRGPSEEVFLRIWVREQQAEFCNIYFSPGATHAPMAKKAKKKDMASTAFAWCEIDPARDFTGVVEDIKPAMLSRIRTFPIKPLAIVESGNGYHVYIAFRRPVSLVEDRAAFETVNKAFVRALKGDIACWNCDRVLRLPGTINFPEAKKRAKGRVASLSRVLEINKGAYCSFADLRAAVEPFLAQAAAEKPAPGLLDGWQELDGDALRATVPPGVAFEMGQGVGRNTEDRSDNIFGVVMSLFECDKPVFDLKQVRAIIDGRPFIEKWTEEGPGRVDEDILRVYGRFLQKGGATRAKPRPEDEFEPIHGAADELPYVDLWKLADEEAPAREWVVENWLPKGQVTLLPGDGGVGKSLLTIQLAYACASGQPWLDMPVEEGPVLILSAEDETKEAWFRLRKIREANLSAVQKHKIYFLDATADLDPQLAAWTEKTGVIPTPLFKKIIRDVERYGITLLVADSAADVFNEEINRHAVRAFIRLLRTLGCTVILLSHPSVDGMKTGRGYSGSSHWSNSVRSRLYMERAIAPDGSEPDEDLRILSTKKANRGRRGNKVFMRWTPQGFIKEPDGAEALRAANAEDVFMSLLRRFAEHDLTVSPNAGRAYAPTLFAEHSESQGIAKLAFKDAMEKLMSAKRIKVETVGPKSRRSQILVEILD